MEGNYIDIIVLMETQISVEKGIEIIKKKSRFDDKNLMRGNGYSGGIWIELKK